MSEKVLLDTDIGSDIDDAICLAYLLSQPECELMGITTVSGEPQKRAMMASSMCKVAGKEIPVYSGIDKPFLINSKQPVAQQAKLLQKWSHDTSFSQYEAVQFLRSTIHKYPGEITLLAIGPMTNIGALFAIDPEIPGLLKELVLMCGVFTNSLAGVGPTEWNAICDPHAAAVVYNAPVMKHRSIGLDVTCRVTLDKKQVMERFSSKILRPVLDFAGVWFEHAEKVTFHDPLAAVTIFDNRICTFKKGNVEVELASEKLKGMTHWTPDEVTGRHEVALDVDAERFFEHYFAVVGKV